MLFHTQIKKREPPQMMPAAAENLPLAVLTGEVHSGKTAFLKKWSSRLEQRGVPVGGYLNIHVKEKGLISGYDLYDIEKKRYTPFLRRGEKIPGQKIGDYNAIPKGWDKAREILLRKKGRMCIVDEVGPLELKGKGIWPVLQDALNPPAISYLLVIRRRILETFLDKMDSRGIKVFDVSSGEKNLVKNLESLFNL